MTIQPIETKARPGSAAEALDAALGLSGTQRVYRFDNGYGASVVRGHGTYGAEAGLWEMAVTRWEGDDWEITYDTPITDDILGWLTDADVEAKLQEIRDLPELTSQKDPS